MIGTGVFEFFQPIPENRTFVDFNRHNYFMYFGFALLMAMYYGHDSSGIEVIFKCNYEGKARQGKASLFV